jgi:zinc transport system substrate-binding protein
MTASPGMKSKSVIKKILLYTLTIASTLCGQTGYVTSIYPFKLILNPLLGGRDSITTLLPPGASPHTFEIKPSDARAIANARALIIGGANLDDWTTGSFPEKLINLQLLIPDSLKMYLDDKKETVNPHFWTDPLTVRAMLHMLTEKLCNLDPQNCKRIMSNSGTFSSMLSGLDTDIRMQLRSVGNRSMMISHPFFNYFLKRYGLDLVGVIETVPGKEPGPREISELIRAGRTNKIRAVYVHSGHEERSATVIADALGIPLVRLDPIGDPQKIRDYAELIRYNVNLIVKAQQ